jgi:hypothetical protein
MVGPPATDLPETGRPEGFAPRFLSFHPLSTNRTFLR